MSHTAPFRRPSADQPARGVVAHIEAMLDALMHEVEAGRAGHAVLLLAGMLDAALERAAISPWRSALLQHPLYGFLAPLSAQRDQRGDQRRHLATLARSELPAGASTALCRLHAAMAPLGFVQALRARRTLSLHALTPHHNANATNGRRVAIIGDAPDLNQDQLYKGWAVTMAADWRDLTTFAQRNNARFDQVLAPDLADHVAEAALPDVLAALRPTVSSDGVLTLSSFAPSHVGRGWQEALLGRAPQCHSEQAWGRAAQAAGLALHHRRDASNALIWCDLRPCTPPLSGAGQ